MRMREVYVQWFKGHNDCILYLWKFIQKVSQFRNSVLLIESSREFALRRRREQDRERRARESAEEREARLSRRRIRDRQRTRERRASETAVQREVRLVSRRIRDRARRAEESEKWFKGHALNSVKYRHFTNVTTAACISVCFDQ